VGILTVCKRVYMCLGGGGVEFFLQQTPSSDGMCNDGQFDYRMSDTVAVAKF
jgi:hypothetical protein